MGNQGYNVYLKKSKGEKCGWLRNLIAEIEIDLMIKLPTDRRLKFFDITIFLLKQNWLGYLMNFNLDSSEIREQRN